MTIKPVQTFLWTEMQVAPRLAPGQERVYAFIVEYKRTHDGNSPTYGQIATGCCISAKTAYIHCLKLFRWGRIAFTEDRRIILVGGEYSPPE